MRFLLSMLLLATVTAFAADLGSGGTTDRRDRDGYYNRRPDVSAGSQGGLSWGSMDLKAAREAGKPVILYVYDETVKKDNHTVNFLEYDIFGKAEAQKALAGYTLILVSKTSQSFPDTILKRAEGGAAIYLMTCDGSVHAFWKKDLRPSLDEFTMRAHSVAASNPKVVERLKKEVPVEVKHAEKVDLTKAAPPMPVKPIEAYRVEADPVAQKEIIKRLTAQINAAVKAGEKLKAWLTLNSRPEEIAVAGADEKGLKMAVEGNVIPLKWEKIAASELLDLTKNIAKDKGERLVLAGEMALALGKADDAIALLAQARANAPEQGAKIDGLVARITKSAAQ